jgi:hypothetical protein
MKMSDSPETTKRPLLLAVSVLSLVLIACGTDGGSTNTGGTDGMGGTGGSTESASCRICVGSTPIGPNESEESCAALGALYDCENTGLQGECPDQGACVVTGCSSTPDCDAELP